jgi:membrane fusion protein, copper/silver efflux system
MNAFAVSSSVARRSATHLMKRGLFINQLLMALMVVSFLSLLDGCSRSPSPKETVKESPPPAKALWTCSMCPQIRQEHPGECPMCGMKLVPLRSVISNRASLPEQVQETVIHLDAVQSASGNIRISPVEEKIVQRKVELFGEFSYVTDKQIDFTWYYGGRIQKTLVDYNTTEIKEGVPLMEIYSEEAINDQRDCLKMLMELRWHTKDEQKIFDAQYGTNAERVSLTGMSYEHKNMNARLNAMKDRLSRIGMTAEDFQALEVRGKIRDTFTITAPEKGTLLGALPHVGERFTMDSVLFRLVPLNEVWFVADVYEQDLSLLKIGQEITIRCRTYTDQLFKGKLVFIGREVDSQKRTLKARFLVSNPNGLLLPQLSASGRLDVGGEEPHLAVPASAVIDTGSRQLVYVETSPGTYALRIVKVGTEGELQGDESTRWVTVIDGLTLGEKVVTSGAFLVDAEAQLRGLPGSGSDPVPAKP